MALIDLISRYFSPDIALRARAQFTSELQVTTGGEGHLSIPVPDITQEDKLRDQWQKRGQTLARQEDWDILSELMQQVDDDRVLTPGGMSVAELLAYGARADVVGAVEHAFLHGQPDAEAPLLAGVEDLETVLSDYPEDPAIAVIVANTHIDMAWTWRGQGDPDHLSELNREAFAAHMDRAREILSPFHAQEDARPSVLAAWCGLHSAEPDYLDELVADYTRLLDLSPLDFRQMRAFGRRLSATPGSDINRLDIEARKVAGRHNKLWGSGGYTWMMLDAMCQHTSALEIVGAEHFVAGLRDILAMQQDQFTVNLLAAYCAIAMKSPLDNPDADVARDVIHQCYDWIVCDYLTELHPLIWAHAGHRFDNNLRIHSVDRFAAQGRKEAERVLNLLFLPELARGQNVIFTRNGPATQMP